MPETRDALIVGGGHNGLITAFYLARAGHKPLVIERRPQVGGAAITDEFHPGFRCSTLAHAAGPLRVEVLRDMNLEQHGLKMIRPDIGVTALSPEGAALLLYNDTQRAAQEIAKFSEKDAAKYTELRDTLDKLGKVLQQALALTPPDIDRPGSNDLWALFKTGKALKGLGRKDMFRLLRWGPMAAADFVSEWFETELLRATVAGGIGLRTTTTVMARSVSLQMFPARAGLAWRALHTRGGDLELRRAWLGWRAFATESEDFILVNIPHNTNVVKLLQRIRDESHRFAVSYHSVLKVKKQTASLLDDIPTIGPATRKKLIKTFGSMRGVLQARDWELDKAVGDKKAAILRQYLRPIRKESKANAEAGENR